MDKQIRRNEHCVIGLPRCDFVFSSTRTCFIGYGFGQSNLEVEILKSLLAQRGIEAVEAGATLAPAQNAFCAKICSKIIVAQFCIILLNEDVRDGNPAPNANVNQEYGLMLGFNKYVIPFQRQIEQLPFNVAGLDTVKYDNENFRRKAERAIDLAIQATTQESVPQYGPDQVLEAFLLSKRLLFVPITNDDERALFELGRALGFNMVMTFDGLRYMYFGNFTTLRPEIVLWRLRTLETIIRERFDSIPKRIELGLVKADPRVRALLRQFTENLQIHLLVTSDEDRSSIQKEINTKPAQWHVEIFALSDIEAAMRNLAK